jgi:hypothetical protein
MIDMRLNETVRMSSVIRNLPADGLPVVVAAVHALTQCHRLGPGREITLAATAIVAMGRKAC